MLDDEESARIAELYAQLRGETRSGWHPGRAGQWQGSVPASPELLARLRVDRLVAVDDLAVVRFAWLEAGTPDLDYLVLAPVDRSRPAAIPGIVGEQLRRLLRGHWRDRVTQTWIGHRLVLVTEPEHPATSQARRVLWDGGE